VNFLSLLTIVFIVLRLTGVIDWSWWLVLSPILGLLVLFFGVVTLEALAKSAWRW